MAAGGRFELKIEGGLSREEGGWWEGSRGRDILGWGGLIFFSGPKFPQRSRLMQCHYLNQEWFVNQSLGDVIQGGVFLMYFTSKIVSAKVLGAGKLLSKEDKADTLEPRRSWKLKLYKVKLGEGKLSF